MSELSAMNLVQTVRTRLWAVAVIDTGCLAWEVILLNVEYFQHCPRAIGRHQYSFIARILREIAL